MTLRGPGRGVRRWGTIALALACAVAAFACGVYGKPVRESARPVPAPSATTAKGAEEPGATEETAPKSPEPAGTEGGEKSR